MRVLFLSLSKVWNLSNHDIYEDLLREIINQGNDVYIVTPVERKYKEKTSLSCQEHAQILKVKTLNIQKTNFLEKGIGTVLLERQFLKAIKKYYKGISFDLILYATPPITLVNPIKYIKKRDHARTYLMLKDIFPQNAVDLGMMRTSGIKGVLYKIFREKEKQLYAISDRIGCMSQANVDYVLKHNPEILNEKVEVCPNSIEFVDMSISEEVKDDMRKKYNLPVDKRIFVYGGNLGKPQGIPFIIECLRSGKDNNDVFFLIVGDGTEYGKLASFVEDEHPANVKLMQRLPKNDYDRMIAACDVGMIFLDHRFTIPNFPSRLLSYMQAGIPVLACTDPNTDIGRVVTDGGFGWWCESNDIRSFSDCINVSCTENAAEKGQNGLLYLKDNYTVEKAYQRIMCSLES